MHTLSNETLSIQVATKGAELQSIFKRQNNQEYMWEALPAWPKKSPVLFPIVGELKDSSYTYKDKKYTLPRHGFAREQDFVLESQTEDSLVFTLSSSAETRQVYPFDFVFKVIYTLQQAKLTLRFEVKNTGDDLMFFSLGAHPAFAVPLDKSLEYDDYFLDFNAVETTARWPLTPEGLIKHPPYSFLENTNKLPLEKSLFEKDAIVFKDLESTTISLRSLKSPHGLSVSYEGFPYMGIWAAKGADFVCIEPWCGIADSEGTNGKLEEKEGIIELAQGARWSKSYSIEVF